MTRRALVTGGHGFVAQWAIRAMLERDWSVTAAGIDAPVTGGPLDAHHRDAVTWTALDVTQQEQVATVLERAAPDVVLHLAAISRVLDALRDPGQAYGVNAVGTVRLLTEVGRMRRAGTCDPVVLVVGSAEQYGRHEPSEMPLAEDAPQRPLTVYAGSKAAQEVAALQAHRSDGVRVVCTRSFSHSGPGQPANFVLPSLVSRALAASVVQRVGVSAEISPDPARSRPVDVPVQVGSNAKLRRATGWAPRHTREDIIDDLIHAATR